MDINNLDFSQESQAIVSELTNMLADESTITLDSITNLHTKMAVVLNKLNTAMEQVDLASKQKKRLKTLKKSMGYKGRLEREDFLAAYDQFIGEGGKNRSKTLRSREDIESAFDSFSEAGSDMLIKKYVSESYALIMQIRDLFKNHIEYRIFVMGKAGGQDVILMGNPTVEQLVSQAQVSSSQVSLQLEYTGAQLQQILNDYIMNQSTGQQWSNLLDNDENLQQAWQILLSVKEKMTHMKSNGKKIYYSFGQLIEALVYLQDKELTSANVYDALKQGKNTTPFEVSGDFTLDDIDVQSKAFSTYDQSGTELHRIRLMNLANVRRVLNKIYIAIGNSMNNPSALKTNLEAVFNSSGNETAWNVVEQDIKQIAQEAINEIMGIF